ncbi:MAG: hypothetical protein ACK4UN_00170 [Limisphaerales bacterium]
MCMLWRGLENLGGWTAVPARWQRVLGADYESIHRQFLTRTGEESSWVPSKAVCRCSLEVVRHDDGEIVGISDCGTSGCNDVKLSASDIEFLEVKPSKVARELARAFGWDHHEAEMGIKNVRQIGTYGPGCLPIILAIPQLREEFSNIVWQLVGRFSGGFVLLTPSKRCVDGNALGELRRANAGYFALETLVTLEPEGGFQATQSAAELFGQFLPQRSFAQPANGPVAPAARYRFEHAGSFWKVVFDGSPEFVIEDTLGAKYLNYLLHRPNEVISAFDLEVAITPEKGLARKRNSIQRDLDPETMRQYLRELDKLRALRDQAEDFRNFVEIARLDEEIEAIEKELTKNGSPADTGERARGNVRKAVAAVRKKLLAGDKFERAFGEHIQNFVDTSFECVYKQSEGRIWGLKMT